MWNRGIRRQGDGFKSHQTDWENEPGIKLRSPEYKDSDYPLHYFSDFPWVVTNIGPEVYDLFL